MKIEVFREVFKVRNSTAPEIGIESIFQFLKKLKIPEKLSDFIYSISNIKLIIKYELKSMIGEILRARCKERLRKASQNQSQSIFADLYYSQLIIRRYNQF